VALNHYMILFEKARYIYFSSDFEIGIFFLRGYQDSVSRLPSRKVDGWVGPGPGPGSGPVAAATMPTKPRAAATILYKSVSRSRL